MAPKTKRFCYYGASGTDFSYTQIYLQIAIKFRNLGLNLSKIKRLE